MLLTIQFQNEMHMPTLHGLQKCERIKQKCNRMMLSYVTQILCSLFPNKRQQYGWEGFSPDRFAFQLS